ncbi:tRNA (adenosine(37)-N6)-dimethylallyltransferase MiaA [Patescibacteria group bacterium]
MPKKKISYPKIIVIAGPTASGKTSMALDLAKKYNGEIISADSQQVYKYFNIGTGKEGNLKTNKDKLKIYRNAKGVRQYLVDFVDPVQQFNVVDFQNLCYQKIEQVIKSGKTPFLVGGTGLYIDAVCEGYEFSKSINKPKITRSELEKKDLDKLLVELKRLDPESFKNIDTKNKRRVIRALDLTINSGKPFSAQQKNKKPPYHFLKLAIDLPAEKLKARINRRVDDMIGNGLAMEVRSLLEKYSKDYTPFNSIGYKEVAGYLQGKYDINEVAQQIKINSWQLATRQMTWFRKSQKIRWVQNLEQADKLIKDFLTK